MNGSTATLALNYSFASNFLDKYFRTSYFLMVIIPKIFNLIELYVSKCNYNGYEIDEPVSSDLIFTIDKSYGDSLVKCKNAIGQESWYVECKDILHTFDYNSFPFYNLMKENIKKSLKLMDHLTVKLAELEK